MISDLQKLGFTRGEAKVYAALLKLGTSSVGPIVRKAKVAASNIYEILDRLEEKGLVSYFTKQKTKHFQATKPTNIREYLEEQEKKIQENKVLFDKLLPQLQRREKPGKEDAEIFVGMKGLRTAYDSLLAGGGEGLFFYVHNEQYYEESELFYRKLWKRIEKTGTKWRGISNKEFKTTKLTKKYPSFMQQRYVNFPLPGIIDIVSDKVLMTTWQESPVGILIHSKEIADNFRKYFETVWKTAEK